MKGRYEISISNKSLRYEFVVQRKYTIMRGFSASGKSELVRLVKSKGVSIKTSGKCKISILDENYEAMLEKYKGRVFIADESLECINSVEFYIKMQKSDNYFVLISRDKLSHIPFSISEIYELRNNSLVKSYTENVFSSQYEVVPNKIFKPELVITEDKRSGFEFYSTGAEFDVKPADGKSNVVYEVMKYAEEYNSIYAIVDGAAFGSEVAEFLDLVSVYSDKDIRLYTPESFEYLLLLNCNLRLKKEVLYETYNYCDSLFFKENFPEYIYSEKDFESWEKFYKAYISAITKDDKDAVYSKSKLNPYYLRYRGKVIKYLIDKL